MLTSVRVNGCAVTDTDLSEKRSNISKRGCQTATSFNWTYQNLLLLLVIFRIGFYRVCDRTCDHTVSNLAFAVES